MSEVNWGILRPVNALAALNDGYALGKNMRAARREGEVENVLARYRAGDKNALGELSVLDPDYAFGVARAKGATNALAARDAARPLIEAGDYKGAARKVGADDTELAGRLMTMDKDALEVMRMSGRAGATILQSALQLPPDQRAQYVMQHADALQGMGLTPDQIASYPWADDNRIKADVGRFMSLEDLVGTVSVQKFGDNLAEVRVSPLGGMKMGQQVPIPETRGEKFDRDRFAYQRQQGEADNRRADAKMAQDREEFDYQRGRDPLPGIKAKIARGEELTPGEERLYSDSLMGKVDPVMGALGLGGGGYGGSPAGPGTGGGRAPPVQGTKVGTVETDSQGRKYRFRGGDDKDPNNWVPMK